LAPLLCVNGDNTYTVPRRYQQERILSVLDGKGRHQKFSDDATPSRTPHHDSYRRDFSYEIAVTPIRITMPPVRITTALQKRVSLVTKRTHAQRMRLLIDQASVPRRRNRHAMDVERSCAKRLAKMHRDCDRAFARLQDARRIKNLRKVGWNFRCGDRPPPKEPPKVAQERIGRTAAWRAKQDALLSLLPPPVGRSDAAKALHGRDDSPRPALRIVADHLGLIHKCDIASKLNYRRRPIYPPFDHNVSPTKLAYELNIIKKRPTTTSPALEPQSGLDVALKGTGVVVAAVLSLRALRRAGRFIGRINTTITNLNRHIIHPGAHAIRSAERLLDKAHDGVRAIEDLAKPTGSFLSSLTHLATHPLVLTLVGVSLFLSKKITKPVVIAILTAISIQNGAGDWVIDNVLNVLMKPGCFTRNFRKVAGIPEPAGVVAQSLNSDFMVLFTSVMMCRDFAKGRTIADIMNKNVGSHRRTAEGLQSYVDDVCSTMTGVINVFLRIFGVPEIQGGSEFYRWHAECAHFCSLKELATPAQGFSYSMMLRDLYQRGTKLLMKADPVSRESHSIEMMLSRMRSCSTDLCPGVADGNTQRSEPVFIICSGKAGVGKSVFERFLAEEHISMRYGSSHSPHFSPDMYKSFLKYGVTEKFLYSSYSGQKHFDTYANQCFCRLDDFEQKNVKIDSDPENSQMLKVVNWINTVQCPMTCAELANKGKKNFDTPMVYASTNIVNWQSVYAQLRDANAFKRRVHRGLILSVKEEFRTPQGRLDYVKAMEARRLCIAAANAWKPESGVPRPSSIPECWIIDQISDFYRGPSDQPTATDVIRDACCEVIRRESAFATAVNVKYDVVPEWPSFESLAATVVRESGFAVSSAQALPMGLAQSGEVALDSLVEEAGEDPLNSHAHKRLVDYLKSIRPQGVEIGCESKTIEPSNNFNDWVKGFSSIPGLTIKALRDLWVGYSGMCQGLESKIQSFTGNTLITKLIIFAIATAVGVGINATITALRNVAAGAFSMVGSIFGASDAPGMLRPTRLEECDLLVPQSLLSSTKPKDRDFKAFNAFKKSASLFSTRNAEVEAHLGQVIHLTKKHFLIPQHFVWTVKAQLDREVCIKFSDQIERTISAADFLKLPMVSFDHHDLCMVSAWDDLMVGTPVGPAIKFWMTNSDLDAFRKVRGPTAVGALKLTAVGKTLSVLTTGRLVTNAQYVDVHGNSYNLAESLNYDYESQSGFCGAMLYARTMGRQDNYIMGLHAAGAYNSTTGGRAYADVISREELEGAMRVLSEREGPRQPASENLTAQCGEDVADYFRVTGREKRSGPVIAYSAIWKTPFCKDFVDMIETPKVPIISHLTRSGVSPDQSILESLKPYSIKTRPTVDIPDLEVEEAKAVLNARFRILRNPDENLGLLSDHESVFGRPNAQATHSLNFLAGPGWPWNKDNIKKATLLGLNSDHNAVVSTRISDAFYERVRLLEKAYQEGAPTDVRYYSFKKDELRKPGRWARLISSCPVDYCIVGRKYFQDAAEWLTRHRFENGLANGVNVYSEWGSLVAHLRSRTSAHYENEHDVEKNIIAGDYTGFDTSHSHQMLWAVLDVVNTLYDDEHSETRRNIWKDLVHSKHVVYFNGAHVFFEWDKALPSGHFFTSFVNGIINLLLLIMCFRRVCPNKDFWSEVFPIVYGDDNIITVSPSSKAYNQKRLGEELASLGYIYTREDKTSNEDSEAFRKINECDFLKRTTCPNRDFVGALAKDSIISPLVWTKLNPLSAAFKAEYQGVLVMSLLEASLHSFDFWCELGTRLQRTSREYGWGDLVVPKTGLIFLPREDVHVKWWSQALQMSYEELLFGMNSKKTVN